MAKFISIISFVGFFLTGFVGGAQAQEVIPEMNEITKRVLDAISAGDYPLAIVFALILLVGLIRKYGGKFWPKLLESKLSAAALVFVGAFLASISDALVLDKEFNAGLLWHAATLAGAAAGGYSLIRIVGISILDSKAPKWLKTPISIFLPILDKLFPSTKEKEAAKEVGKKAKEKATSAQTEIEYDSLP